MPTKISANLIDLTSAPAVSSYTGTEKILVSSAGSTSVGNFTDVSTWGLQTRLGTSVEMSTFKNANQAYIRYFLTTGATTRTQPQGIAFNEVTRKFYVYYGTDQTISEFNMDASVGQVALSSSLTTSSLGASGLAIEHTATGQQFWAPSSALGKAVRFPYVAGAQPDVSQVYQFFDTAVGTNTTIVTISEDQLFLIAISAALVVNVYSLAAVVAAGPGDFRNAYLFQWTMPTTQFPGGTGVVPAQSFAAKGGVLYCLAGSGASLAPSSVYGYDLQTGKIVSKGDSLQVGLSDAAAVEAGNTNSPEGIGFIDGKLALLFSQGATSTRRSNRIYLCAKKSSTAVTASDAFIRWNAAFPGIRYPSTRQFLIKTVFEELIDTGLYDDLSFLYMANSEEIGSAINLVNPSQKLTNSGAVTYTQDRGWTSDGVSSYLDTGLSPMAMPNFEMNSAHLGAYITGTTANASLMGEISGTSLWFNPRTPGSTFSTRFNQTTGDNFSTSVTAGHFVMNRTSATTYDKYVDLALANSVTSTATTLSSASNIGILQVNGAVADVNMQLLAAHAGLGLTTTQLNALHNIIIRYLAEIGAI